MNWVVVMIDCRAMNFDAIDCDDEIIIQFVWCYVCEIGDSVLDATSNTDYDIMYNQQPDSNDRTMSRAFDENY